MSSAHITRTIERWTQPPSLPRTSTTPQTSCCASPSSAVLVAGIDVGLNNLAAITANKPGFVPVLVNGRPAKYINQGYNKRRAELQAKLGQPGRSKRMERLTTKRTRQINH
jgi:transposase